MPIDVATWRSRTGFHPCSRGLVSKPTVVTCYALCSASVIVVRGCTTGQSNVRLALFVVTLLLCAGIEPNPGPTKHEELSAKMDAVMEEMRSLHKDTTDRLEKMNKEIATRLSNCESSVAAMKINIDQLNTVSADNAAATAKVTSDLAQFKEDLKATTPGGSAWPPLGRSADLPAPRGMSAISGSPPAIHDIYAELKRRDEKKLNIVVFGLSPLVGVNDEQKFNDLARNELSLTPHITKVLRLGAGNGGKPPPLLVSLRDETDKLSLLRNAKKLRASSLPAVKNNVFINPDLTLLERQHAAALREELKLRKAAGENNIGIRGGKIVHVTPKP
jgi:uncharacterized coiled-coil protein SlyX